MAKSIPPTVPPMEVLTEFLSRLRATVTERDGVVLVLRGSFLLRHWFGAAARPAADIDIESFERDRIRPNGRFPPAIYGRSLCLWATEAGQQRPPSDGNVSRIGFEPIIPEDGTDLWDYGTPGERCYTLWVQHSHGEEGALPDNSGRLQIDIAQAGSYDLADLPIEEIELSTLEAGPFRMQAYSAEFLLAAKLSWLMRSIRWHADSSEAPRFRWNGQLKDLFDAHLLLTLGNLRPRHLERALYAVGAEDKLDWGHLEAIFNVSIRQISDEDFPNWQEFQEQHEELIECGPAQMLQTVAERLLPLLEEFRQQVPFFLAINKEPDDIVPYLIYADWLEARADPRSNFLRLYIESAFRPEPTALERGRRLLAKLVGIAENQTDNNPALAASMSLIPPTWFYQVFGSADRYRLMRDKWSCSDV